MAKRQREVEKQRKADEKRERRRKKKQLEREPIERDWGAEDEPGPQAE